jgi:hypothetical protein
LTAEIDSAAEPPPKKARPSTSKQGQTLTALSEVGEGTKSIGESLDKATAQEQERIKINQAMLDQYKTANVTRSNQHSEQLRMNAAEAIGNLREFEDLEEDEQFAVQAWLDDDSHAVQVLKTIPALRGRWLKRKLGEMLEAQEDKVDDE